MKDLFIDSEPAFAKSAYVSNEGSIDPPQQGMSKRFYAACMAMAAIISKETQFGNNIGLPDITMTIREAYSYADELLERELR